MTFRYFGALRFFLALLVVFHHFGIHLASGVVSDIAKAWLPGVPAVLIFFVLCGFAMAESATSIYENRPGSFLANRALRILPPFWIALTIQIVVHLLLPDGTGHSGAPLPSAAFTTTNLVGNYLYFWPSAWPWDYHNPYDFLLIVWTLRYEIVFYVAIAAALLLCRGDERRLTAAFVWGSGVVLLCASYFRATATGEWAGFHTGHWPFFTIGILAYFIAQKSTMIRKALLAFAIVVAVSGFPYITPYDLKIVFREAGLFCGLLYVTWLLADVRSERWRDLDAYLGSLSYAIYLTHVIVMTTVLHLGAKPGLLTFSIAIVAALAFAIVFNLAVESWLTTMRDRVRGQKLTGKPREEIRASEVASAGNVWLSLSQHGKP